MLIEPKQAEDRITRAANGEMTVCRYYMPPSPASREECPTFTSQTMLQSLRGNDKRTQKEPDYVTVARVAWTAFTPRFMAQDKIPSRFKMEQRIMGRSQQVAYRGPFHYRFYNGLSNLSNTLGQPEEYDDAAYNNDATVVPFRCARPTPAQYQSGAGDYKAEKDYHATRGVELELLEDSDDNLENGGGRVLGKSAAFTNPNIVNRLQANDGQPVKVRADRLRYRVRFRYPNDQMADPGAPGGKWIDPATQYLVDTPVFDDVSVTYFTKPRILDFRDLME